MKTYQVDVRLIDEDGYAIVDKYEALNYTDILELYAMAYVLKCKDVQINVYDDESSKKIAVEEFIFTHSYLKRVMKQGTRRTHESH